MTAETLRRAAALMRERAEAATPGPWQATVYGVRAEKRSPVAPFDGQQPDMENRLYIASWHPAVTLAVADWLDSTANDVEHVHTPVYNLTSTTVARAVAVARAYLGEPR